MSKNFKSVKASLIMSIFLFSLFAAIVPATSTASAAGGGNILGLNHVIFLNWKETGEDAVPINPYEGTGVHTMELKYYVNKGAIFGSLIYQLLAGRTFNINLEIIEYPSEYSTVTLPVNYIPMTIPDQPGPGSEQTQEITMTITVTNKAPALTEQAIRVRVSAPQVGPIPALENIITLKFKPAYLGKLNVVTEKQNILIGPMDSVTSIPIRVTNDGNGQTFAKFAILDVPEGWSALITDHVILDPTETETIYLTVTPPQGFGYHDDRFTFTIEYTPAWNINTGVVGETEQITISVQSRGISVVGIEVALPIIILIIVILFVLYIFVIKKLLRK